MSGVSRRDFLRQLGGEWRNHQAGSSAQKFSEPQDWVAVARLSELQPGTSRSVRAGTLEITLRSTGEGVQARLPNGKCVALRSRAGGWVEVNASVEWLPTSGMSHLTGELTKLNELER